MSGDFLIWQLHSRAGGEVGGNSEGGLIKIKILFTGMVGPYRKIFPSVLKTSLGLRPRAVFKTSRNISLYGTQSGK